MGRSAILTIKILADATQASREMDTASGKMGKFQSGIGKAAIPAAALLGGMAAFGVAAGKAASEAEQAMGAVDAAFGKSAGAVHKFAETSATSVGLASREYEGMAAVFGSQLRNMGVAAGDLAPKTNDLVKLGADLAAQFGGDTSTAVEALGSLLRGETDPIEQYGVSIKQADISAQKAKMGLDGLTGSADKAATTQATLALLTQQTAAAHGAFARESDTAAGAQQRATAQWEDAKAQLGQALLPVMVLLATQLSGIASLLSDHIGLVTIAAGVIASLAAAVLITNGIMKAWNAITVIANAVQKAAAVATTAWRVAVFLLNLAWAANPFVVVIALIALLVGAMVLAYQHSETFRRIVDAAFRAVKAAAQFAWDWIKEHWPLLLVIVTGPIGAAVLVVARHWDSILAGAKAVIGWFRDSWDVIKTILVAPFTAAWNLIQDIIQKITSAVSAVTSAIKKIPVPHIPDLNPFSAAPATVRVVGAERRGVAHTTASSSGGGVHVTVNGALDPEGVARQIRRILAGHDVRVGRTAVTAT